MFIKDPEIQGRKIMSNLLSAIKTHLKHRPEQAKLSQTQALKEIEAGEIKETLTSLYKEKDLNGRLLASILNSIFTQQRAVFLFSRPIFISLLEGDANAKKRKTVSGSEFNNLMLNWGNFFQRIKTPAKGEKRAAVYKIVDDQLLTLLKNHITNNIIQGQLDQCVALFDSYKDTSNKISSKTSSEQEQDIESEVEREILSPSSLPAYTGVQAQSPVSMPSASGEESKGDRRYRSSVESGCLARALHEHNNSKIHLTEFEVDFCRGNVQMLEKFNNGLKSANQKKIYGQILDKLRRLDAKGSTSNLTVVQDRSINESSLTNGELDLVDVIKRNRNNPVEVAKERFEGWKTTNNVQTQYSFETFYNFAKSA